MNEWATQSVPATGPEAVLRALVGDSGSVNGVEAKDGKPAVWACEETRDGIDLTFIARAEGAVSTLHISALPRGTAWIVTMSVLLFGSPVPAGLIARWLGLGWWSLAVAVAAPLLLTQLAALLTWPARKRTAARAESLRESLSEQAAQLLSARPPALEPPPQAVIDRAQSVTATVSMANKSFDQSESARAKGKDTWALVKLDSARMTVDLEPFAPGSDVLARMPQKPSRRRA
ncbi:MAG: hypothetical protein KJO07_23735 [Deltaproteobacteria bacterium]|nr:hypothetical protein [Deltaproteobacteria bacterium]